MPEGGDGDGRNVVHESSGKLQNAVYCASEEAEKLFGVFRSRSLAVHVEAVRQAAFGVVQPFAGMCVERGPHRRGAHIHGQDQVSIQNFSFHWLTAQDKQ